MFKRNDIVQCIDVSGTSGRHLIFNTLYTVESSDESEDRELITLREINTGYNGFYYYRFVLFRRPSNISMKEEFKNLFKQA